MTVLVLSHQNNIDMPSKNQAALNDASNIQRETREALQRIQRQAAETHEVGQTTLAELEEQDVKLDRVQGETGKLHEKLNKTKKLQDRFAAWSLQLGTRRAARKTARKERKEEQDLERLDANETREDSKAVSDMDEVQDKRNEADKAHKAKRSELFGRKGKNRKTRPNKSKPEEQGEKLTDEDQAHLDQINMEDDDINAGLDVLGNQMDALLAMAQTMGDESAKQNKKLDKTTDDLYDAKKKQQVANNRARLFTTTRREKRNERNLEKKAKMAAKLITS